MMAGSKPKKIKEVFHVLVFIFVMGLIMYFSNFHSFASEMEETTTGEYDNFTTYYRIVDKNNVSMSASDILYSGSEVANILDISKEDITLSKISDGI
ncbi:MAG: hypothetical protein LBM02_06995, partial [Lachnospiraceae bacterium]|nr:hypothetical protein [Lachnospiraceae bacterium]